MRVYNFFSVKLKSLSMWLSGFFLSITFLWRIKNYSAIKNFENTDLKLSKFEENLLHCLKRDGVAVTSIDKFCPKHLDQLIEWKSTIRNQDEVSSIKDFLIYYLGGAYQTEDQKFYSNNPLISFSYNENILNIVNSYFGMWSNLVYLEANETKLVNQKEPLKKSQMFHRDPGINKCIKVFVYLNDVQEGGGPFTYVKGSHRYGKYWSLHKQRFFGAGGSYLNQNERLKNIDDEDIYEIYGKAGSVIFADTTGIHCGGNSWKNTREMTTSLYYPPGDLLKSKIFYDFDIEELHLDDVQKFALVRKTSK